MSDWPKVLFVCVKDTGKSHMDAGLMKGPAGDTVEVSSAGTRPGTALHELSVQSLADGRRHHRSAARALPDRMVRAADVVVTLGSEASVQPAEGTRFEQWITDEPSERGIDGIERMRLVGDDIARRVATLAVHLVGDQAGRPDHGRTRRRFS